MTKSLSAPKKGAESVTFVDSQSSEQRGRDFLSPDQLQQFCFSKCKVEFTIATRLLLLLLFDCSFVCC